MKLLLMGPVLILTCMSLWTANDHIIYPGNLLGTNKLNITNPSYEPDHDLHLDMNTGMLLVGPPGHQQVVSPEVFFGLKDSQLQSAELNKKNLLHRIRSSLATAYAGLILSGTAAVAAALCAYLL